MNARQLSGESRIEKPAFKEPASLSFMAVIKLERVAALGGRPAGWDWHLHLGQGRSITGFEVGPRIHAWKEAARAAEKFANEERCDRCGKGDCEMECVIT